MERKQNRDRLGLNRRTFVKSAFASSLVGTGMAAPTAAASDSTFVLEQGDTKVPITPLSYDGQTIEEFYGFTEHGHHHSNTETNIERTDLSQLFLWNGPKGLSLVTIHDAPHNGTRGEVTFEFSGLPNSGSWVVRDDDTGNDTYFGNSRAEWIWNGKNTDGGAYRGLDADGDIPFADRLHIDPENSPKTALSNEWHYKERLDQSVEGIEGPVWVFVFADNAGFDSQPNGDQQRPFTIENGNLVPDSTSSTEPTNDIYFVLKPGTERSTLTFVTEQAGKDNRILFDQETLISNTNQASKGQTFSLPGVSDVDVTISPDFHYGIGEWQVLSGDASNPERYTLDMHQPVTIRSGGSSSPDPGVGALEELLGTKDQQIRSLKDIASPPVPESVVDARAEEFVSSVRDEYQNFDSSTLAQHEEAFKRLVATESVVETMASEPRADSDDRDDVIPKTGEGVTSAAIILASRGLGKLAGKLGGLKTLGKIKKYIVKRVQSYAQNILGGMAAKGIVETKTANKVLLSADEAASNLRNLFESEVTGDQLHGAADTVKDAGLNKVYEEATPDSVTNRVSGVGSTVENAFSDAVYTYYFANEDVADVALPSPEFELPEYAFEYTLDIPEEYLPDVPFVDVPSEIAVDLDIGGEISLPDVPELDSIDKLEDALDLASTGLSGLDPTLDDELEDLVDKIANGELDDQDSGTREGLKSLLIDGTEKITEVAEEIIAVADKVAESEELANLSLAIAGLMILAAALAATGIGVALAVPLIVALGKLATLLAVISTVTTLTPLVVGGGYLTVLDKAHLIGSKAMLNTDLEGVNL